MRCFECGGDGHIASECTFASDTEPPWCELCDQRTRLLGYDGDNPARCPACHPLRNQHLKQLRRCPDCRMLVYTADSAPCGQHSSPVAPDRKPPIGHIHKITGRTA